MLGEDQTLDQSIHSEKMFYSIEEFTNSSLNMLFQSSVDWYSLMSRPLVHATLAQSLGLIYQPMNQSFDHMIQFQ